MKSSALFCIRCKAELEPSASGWVCSDGCAPSAGSLAPGGGELHNCDHCRGLVAARGLRATRLGVFCSAECAGEAALRDVTQIPCPICDDGPASPRYRGTCSVVCEAVRDEESAAPRRRVLFVGQIRGGAA